ncbi:hypothetical protein [Tuberibacillus sp. Marseille-P3662]|uniref:hypothetical protein n=1 Tax=Tuberibacillus sp. Marseille-P3662 TaxID=1965358 RepID=UPI000A1CEDF6|nr:hypothetical protein [Tuberibacillus sp. Marseille-P3662]
MTVEKTNSDVNSLPPRRVRHKKANQKGNAAKERKDHQEKQHKNDGVFIARAILVLFFVMLFTIFGWILYTES